MTKAGKLVKDMLKAKKESVMGKLGDSPYEDPMEPWSAKYNQPVKEEVLNEDGLLMKYIRSLGFNPEFMSFSQRSSYARSNAFKTYKTSHTFDVKKQNLKQEETVEEGKHDNRDSYQRDYDSSRTGFSRPAKHRDSERHDLDAPKPPRDRQRYPRPPVDLSNLFKSVQKKEETEQSDDLLDEAGNGFLMSFIKAKGLSPLSMDGNQKAAYSRSSEFKLFKKRHMKETSGMGERGDDWNEQAVKAKSKKSDPPFDGPYIKLDPVVVDKSGAKHTDNSRVRDLARKQMQKLTVKEEADAKDVVTMDIPLLIRVLEFIREDVKTDMDLHRVVENLIDLRTEGVLTMEDYDEIVDIPSKSVKEETISELKNSTLDSYIDRVATGPSRGVTQKGTLKSIKAIGGVTTALRKKFEKPLAELKKQDDNMEIDDRITREEVSPKGKKDLEYDERMKSALSREKTSVPKKPLGDYERKVAKYLKNKHGMSEGSGGNWYIRANGKILNDTKFKPVIFSSEDEARSYAMKLADKKRIPLSQIKLTKSWMDAPEQGVAEGEGNKYGSQENWDSLRKDIRSQYPYKKGTNVTVPHKGKLVNGKIVRYEAGKGGYSPTYVVDIGEYESIMVPPNKVRRDATESLGTTGAMTNGEMGEGKRNLKCVCKTHGTLQCPVHTPKDIDVLEGAKVDRMVKHVAKSEKKLGHSKKEAENIAWATANKRGMLDNKNKKA